MQIAELRESHNEEVEALKKNSAKNDTEKNTVGSMALDVQPRGEDFDSQTSDLGTARQSLEEMKENLNAVVGGPKRDLDAMAALAKEAEKRHVEKVSINYILNDCKK